LPNVPANWWPVAINPSFLLQGVQVMLRLAVVFLIIAMLAALSGFGVISGMAWEGARIFFFIFLVLAILSLFMGYRGRPIDNI
jgi:uncharacterized membrane protein YtjA (UPF0391 family)